MTHDELVRRAEHWLLKSKGCAFVLTDHLPSQLSEAPDAIGFKPLREQSFLVEVKVSRADFLADAKKPWRRRPEDGMGSWRYYLTPPGLVQPYELPAGWRLLWCDGRRIRRIHDPDTGNMRPDFPKRAVETERRLCDSALAWLQRHRGPFSAIAEDGPVRDTAPEAQDTR